MIVVSYLMKRKFKKIFLEVISNYIILNIKFFQWKCQRPRFYQTYRGTGQRRIRYYKLYNSFNNDKRLSSPLKIAKMSDRAKEKCIEIIENDSNMSSIKFSFILRDKNLANVSKTTIVNALNKLGYT